MASSASSVPVRSPSPGKARAIPTNRPTRRGILAAAAGAGAALIPVTASALTARACNTAAWDAALRAYEDADAALDRFYEQYWNPAVAWVQAQTGVPPELSYTIVSRSGSSWTNRMSPATLDAWADEATPIDMKHARPIRDAYRAWERRNAAAEAAVGMEAIEAEETRLMDIATRARNAMFATPAPHVEAARYKLAMIMDHLAPEEELPKVRADLEKLSSIREM